MTISINEGIGKAHVLSYTFWEFLKEVQELAVQGYELCLENQYFPNQYSGRWEAYFDAPAEGNGAGVEVFLAECAALEELVEIGQELETPAEVVNNQDAETANDIPVAVTEAPEAEEDKPRRGRPKLTRNE